MFRTRESTLRLPPSLAKWESGLHACAALGAMRERDEDPTKIERAGSFLGIEVPELPDAARGVLDCL